MPKFSTRKACHKKKKFLEAYAKLGTVSHACELVGVSYDYIYREIKRDKKFEEACWQAEQKGIDTLEVVAKKRALKNSDTLLIFLLKSKRPEVYGDRLRIAFESSALSKFCDRLIELLHSKLPRLCPHCKTNLNLHDSIAKDMLLLSQELSEKDKA